MPDTDASQPASPMSSAARRLLDYTLTNPLKVLGIAVLAFGGLLLLVFFTDIEHLPALDLQGVASMLYAVSLLGLVLLVCVVGMLVVPGLLVRGLRDDRRRVVPPLQASRASLSYPAEPWQYRPSPGQALEVLPWAAALVASAAVLGWQLFGDAYAGWCIAVIGVAVLGLVLFAAWTARVRPGGEAVSWPALSSEIVLAVASFAMPVAVILQFTVAGGLGREDVGVAALHILVLLVACAIAAWLISAGRRPLHAGLVVAIGLVLMAVVFILTRSATVAPHAVVRKLRLGDIEFARISVTAAGCRQVNAALGAIACVPSADPEGLTQLCPVAIRSRIGTERVLEFGVPAWQERNTPEGKRLVAAWPVPERQLHRVVLGADAMPSWRPLQPALDPTGLVASDATTDVDVQLWRESAASADPRLRRLCEVRLVPMAASAASR